MSALNRPAGEPLIAPQPWCRDHRGRVYSFDEFLKLIESFHGYPAPGVLIGAKMVDIAMRRMPAGVLFDVVCESSKCLPDAVQLLTPCTLGNGWLRVEPLGRYALTLFDKRNGQGARVYVNPARLHSCPETRHWFFGTTPKRKDKSHLLIQEIREAEDRFYGVQTVRVKPEFFTKAPSDPRAVCPECGEAYPAGHGRICRGCTDGMGYYDKEETK
jgi:formylmethanofuran dehydrogenase subunit E